MHTAREEELIALAGELESELMRISQRFEVREEEMRSRSAHKEQGLYSALKQVESLKKQLKLHVDDMTAVAAAASSDAQPIEAKSAAVRRRGRGRAEMEHRRSGEYGFPSPMPARNGHHSETAVDMEDGTVAMVELRSLMREVDLGHASTVSAPAAAYGRQSPNTTARMARQLNRPQRRNIFGRVVHRLVGRRAGRRRHAQDSSV
jgi:hypothetical protein